MFLLGHTCNRAASGSQAEPWPLPNVRVIALGLRGLGGFGLRILLLPFFNWLFGCLRTGFMGIFLGGLPGVSVQSLKFRMHLRTPGTP